MKKQKTNTESQEISYRKLVQQSLPEMWSFQFWASIILAVPAAIIRTMIGGISNLGGGALTSANLKDMLLSWKSPILLILGLALVLWYILVEVFAQIHLTGDVLQGNSVKTWQEIKKGFPALRRFLNPAGILVLLYIFIAVPLGGIGFSISLTKSFYIPNFIMEVILATPLYKTLYIIVLLILTWIGFRYIFTFHGILLGGQTPKEAAHESAQIIKTHWKNFLLGMIKTLLKLFIVLSLAILLFHVLPEQFLANPFWDTLPKDYYIDISNLDPSQLDETFYMVLGYRIFCAIGVLLNSYFYSIVVLLCSSYFMLRITKFYLDYHNGEKTFWPQRPKKTGYNRKILMCILTSCLILLFGITIGVLYNQIFDREEPVKLIAHRAGGTMASENSIEGLELAIDHGCYASEIDVQRTKDGYYIINHDSTFQRLTGVNKAPEEMTLAEIRELRIQDTTGNGQELPVVTLEEMLEVIRGKEKLFVELKGATADRQMVNDVVQIIREADCVEDCVLISLTYDIIDYAETNYSEFETGTLFFMGLGDVSKLNCDLIIMEEELATDARIMRIRDAGKMPVVWTVNTELGMRKFLDSPIDGIITDEILLAEEVQASLDARSTLDFMKDQLSSVFE